MTEKFARRTITHADGSESDILHIPGTLDGITDEQVSKMVHTIREKNNSSREAPVKDTIKVILPPKKADVPRRTGRIITRDGTRLILPNLDGSLDRFTDDELWDQAMKARRTDHKS